ncbi:sensor histidine kinase [Kitasatospora sp. NPDC058048]|uniref:sensor histidine kinase n=1 Tax=Kitasatospora sp. NPDC058048 TaxID=3346313 RepID=UPI0036DF3768
MRRGRRPLGLHRLTRPLSLRSRLTFGFAVALAASALLMLTVVYVGIRWLPTYDLTTAVTVPPGTSFTSAHPYPPTDENPMPPGSDEIGTRAPSPGERIQGPHSTIRTKEDVWNTVLAVSTAGVFIVATAGLLAGRRIAGRLLAPLSELNRAATSAAEGDLSHRINASGPDDELRRLADTFDVTLARLEESFSSHRRFAANAAHELLTPLSTTKTALTMLGDRPDREEFAEILPMLGEANERNIRVVKELLNLAAAEHLTFDPEPVDFTALAEEAVTAATAAGAGQSAHGPEFVLTADDPDCLVRGNSVLLGRLVGNLVDNAVKHNTGELGARVTVDVATESRSTAPDDGPGAVHLTVTNTGPVVDPAVVDRLFEPFYRARPRLDSAHGHGLGLALVQVVARAHGGTVHATALPAGGLAVHVRLPAAAPSPYESA